MIMFRIYLRNVTYVNGILCYIYHMLSGANLSESFYIIGSDPPRSWLDREWSFVTVGRRLDVVIWGNHKEVP